MIPFITPVTLLIWILLGIITRGLIEDTITYKKISTANILLELGIILLAVFVTGESASQLTP